MPMGNLTIEAASAHLRGLFYGKPKTMKTWWALTAAMAGFNVLLFDGDMGHEIINKMPDTGDDGKPWKHRVRIIACGDTLKKPVFCDVLTRFLDGKTIKWDDTLSELRPLGDKLRDGSSHFVLEATKMTPNDVVIVDSWTALCTSLQHNFYNETSLDITKVQKDGNTRGLFEYTGRLASFILKRLKGLDCHVIVIAHEGVHELSKPIFNSQTGKWDREPTGEVNTIIQSTSRNHSASIAGDFSDVLYFNLHGNTNYIDGKATEDRVGGSRSINKEFMLKDLSLGAQLRALGHNPVPDAEMPGCMFYGPGELGASSQPTSGGVIVPSTEKKVGFSLGKSAS